MTISSMVSSGVSLLTSGDEDSPSIAKQLIGLTAASAATFRNPKLARAVSWASMGVGLVSLGQQLSINYKKQQRRNNPTFSVEIMDSGVVEALLNHVRNEVNESQITSMRMAIRWIHKGGSRVPVFKYSISSDFSLDTALAGYEVEIRTPTGNREKVTDSQEIAARQGGASNNNPVLLYVNCKTIEARDAVSEFLESIFKTHHKGTPKFYVNSRWNGFEDMSDIPVRPKESVVLKEGQMERVLTHISDFIKQEDQYVRLGIPYHTGVMLSGKPGSGKSSTAAAIAYELGLDVYFVSLSSVKSDDGLISLLEDIPSHSILILEDVDVARATKERTEKGGEGVTMQGLLNCLDGFVSPHGVITIMTTNHLESMDDAIIRSGRVDLLEEISELDTDQLRRLCEYFIGFAPEDLPEIRSEHGIMSADIVGIIKSYIPNTENAAAEVVEYVKSRTGVFTK